MIPQSYIQIGKRKVGPGYPIFIQAEVANCHNGDFQTAKKMVDAIKDAGVDAVKFQLHMVESEMIPSHPKFHTQRQRALSIDHLKELKQYVESRGMMFMCTPFSREAADELEKIGLAAFKIGSGEITDLPFMDYIARKKKPMIVSTGMAEWHEIEEMVRVVQSHGTPLLLLHAISAYPPSYDILNLGVIPKMREFFRVPIGLSDHTSEIFSAIASVPYGISFLEKHYTLDRGQEGTSDHKVSLEPHEWKTMVDAVRKIERACGNEKQIFDEERPVTEWARHAVVSVRDIPEGAVITADMVSTKRPLYSGIPAKELPKIIGRKTRRAIQKDTMVYRDDIV